MLGIDRWLSIISDVLAEFENCVNRDIGKTGSKRDVTGGKSYILPAINMIS